MVASVGGPANSEPSLQGFIVRLRGLPFTSTSEDVISFFEPLDVVNGGQGVLFSCSNDGRLTGEAFVEFSTEEDFMAAVNKNKELFLGSRRYVEVFPSTKGELYQGAHQRGFFTAVDNARTYIPPLSPSVAASAMPYPPTHHHPLQQRLPEEIDHAFGGLQLSHHQQHPSERQSAGQRAAGPGSSAGAFISPQGQYQVVGMHRALRIRGGGASWVQLPMHSSSASRSGPGFGPPPGSGISSYGRMQSASPGLMATSYEYGLNQQPVLVTTPFLMQHPYMTMQTQTWGPPSGYLAATAAAQQELQQQQSATAAWYGGTGHVAGNISPIQHVSNSGQYHMQSGYGSRYYGASQRVSQPSPHRQQAPGYLHASGGGGSTRKHYQQQQQPQQQSRGRSAMRQPIGSRFRFNSSGRGSSAPTTAAQTIARRSFAPKQTAASSPPHFAAADIDSSTAVSGDAHGVEEPSGESPGGRDGT